MGEIRWRFRITVQTIHSAVHVSTIRTILELLIAGINKQQRVSKGMKANSSACLDGVRVNNDPHYLLVERYSIGKNRTLARLGGSSELVVAFNTPDPAIFPGIPSTQ